MAKITRTFRLEEDLVKRFDEASSALNVDKTSVVTEAIKKFVEGYEMKKFWDTDNLVVVDEIIAPVIGKAQVNHGQANLDKELKVIQSTLRVLDNERKDENGTRYDIDNVFAVIDFENKTCRIEYRKFWIGGAVESETIEFPIKCIEYRDDAMGITKITVKEMK